MDNNFLFHKGPFETFSSQHLWALLVLFLAGLIFILIGKYKLNAQQQNKFLLAISMVPLLGYLALALFSYLGGDFNIQEDLPLHVCRVLALVCPIVIWTNNRFWSGAFYFWILAGTLNAIITPEIENGFPSWDYFAYWMTHGFLVMIPIYQVIVQKLKINFKDLINAFWTANVFMILSLGLNYLIGSNYMYTLRKPDAASILDKMGEWPIYLLTTQLLALVLFLILYVPFVFRKKSKKVT